MGFTVTGGKRRRGGDGERDVCAPEVLVWPRNSMVKKKKLHKSAHDLGLVTQLLVRFSF